MGLNQGTINNTFHLPPDTTSGDRIVNLKKLRERYKSLLDKKLLAGEDSLADLGRLLRKGELSAEDKLLAERKLLALEELHEKLLAAEKRLADHSPGPSRYMLTWLALSSFS